MRCGLEIRKRNHSSQSRLVLTLSYCLLPLLLKLRLSPCGSITLAGATSPEEQEAWVIELHPDYLFQVTLWRQWDPAWGHQPCLTTPNSWSIHVWLKLEDSTAQPQLQTWRPGWSPQSGSLRNLSGYTWEIWSKCHSVSIHLLMILLTLMTSIGLTATALGIWSFAMYAEAGGALSTFISLWYNQPQDCSTHPVCSTEDITYNGYLLWNLVYSLLPSPPPPQS